MVVRLSSSSSLLLMRVWLRHARTRWWVLGISSIILGRVSRLLSLVWTWTTWAWRGTSVGRPRHGITIARSLLLLLITVKEILLKVLCPFPDSAQNTSTRCSNSFADFRSFLNHSIFVLVRCSFSLFTESQYSLPCTPECIFHRANAAIGLLGIVRLQLSTGLLLLLLLLLRLPILTWRRSAVRSAFVLTSILSLRLGRLLLLPIRWLLSVRRSLSGWGLKWRTSLLRHSLSSSSCPRGRLNRSRFCDFRWGLLLLLLLFWLLLFFFYILLTKKRSKDSRFGCSISSFLFLWRFDNTRSK